jgi:hypothetical protein
VNEAMNYQSVIPGRAKHGDANLCCLTVLYFFDAEYNNGVLLEACFRW